MFTVSRYLPFASSTTTTQACSYLFVVCLFSISFLVFLNSSVSFVITDLIGVKDEVGDATGNDKMKHDGQADQVEGKVQKAAGDSKEKLSDRDA